MANFIRNTQVKAMTSIWTAKQKARELADRTAEALTDRTGQGTLDVAITVLISIVLGALILAGLYLIVDDTVLPTITQRIKDMFDYGGKGASFLGTMIVSVGSQLTGSANVGVGSIAILFVIGFVLFGISTRTEQTKQV